MKYSDLSLGQIEAIINKLGGIEGAQLLLRGEVVLSTPEPAWTERDNIIYFSVIKEGICGEAWVPRLMRREVRLSGNTQQMFCCEGFRKSSGRVGVYTDIAILKGTLFRNDEKRTSANIRAVADTLGFKAPLAEDACYILDTFSDEDLAEMGIVPTVVMHDPIANIEGRPSLLYADHFSDTKWLMLDSGEMDHQWSRNENFAFVVSHD